MLRQASALAGTVIILLTATSTPVATATPPGESTAGLAVEVLSDPLRSQPDLELPRDFAAVMGYRPVQEPGQDGRPVLTRSDGTCSSPFGGTRYGFDQACRVHDLAYDLLRYAARTGEPLGSSARRAIDAAFGDRMRARCGAEFSGLDRAGCLFVAVTYEAAVVANSWRQGFAAPASDPLWAVLVPVGLVALFIGLGCLRWRLRRRPCRTSSLGIVS